MALRNPLLALALASLSATAWGQEHYFGILKMPGASPAAPAGIYSFSTTRLPPSLFSSDTGYRLKLGYRYSRFLSVEGEIADFARSEPFLGAANLAPGFRSTGFGVDTIATLPLWKFSFYGRLGAYRGEGRPAFAPYSTSLLGDPAARGTRVRYGLGMRYDFTKAFGIHAEMERYSPLGSSLANDADADLFTVGVMWRF
jgi:OOP family OmpA-OmpF porin